MTIYLVVGFLFFQRYSPEKAIISFANGRETVKTQKYKVREDLLKTQEVL